MENWQHASGGVYEIRLKGPLDRRWFHRFEGMEIRILPEGETILLGPVADQSALFGILNQIRNIGILLIEVRRVHGVEEEGES